MTPWPPRRLSAVPRDWTVRAEIMKAIHTPAVQEDDERLRRRQADLAALHRDDDLFGKAIG